MKRVRSCKRSQETLFTASLIAAFFIISFPALTSGQEYPTKPITIYCGYAAGASTDVTTRALAAGAEKLLGVPVVVENKPGGSATVCAGLVASKSPDGYVFGVVSAGALTISPHLLKVPFNPLKDFTVLLQYSHYTSGLCVLNDSPFKTIDQLITSAKAPPGLSYATPGTWGTPHLHTRMLAERKGLILKHVPTKGGSEANTLLLGKHVDFVGGSGQHIIYLRKGVFRMLVIYGVDKRDPKFPDVPTLREVGCQDIQAPGYLMIGPRGIPEHICSKLGDTFKKVADGPAFQTALANFDLPYDYIEKAVLEKKIAADYEWYKAFLTKIGAKKED